MIAALKADGWTQVAQKGSQVQFKHRTEPGRVTVLTLKGHSDWNVRSIEKQSALKLR
ncbi:type II toxin-antitoxin system HicA family toxin [Bradyrhizobium yuanmingense]|uniref:type II toxin-antitoxin system HicA family toxin n=1 Tax=Bradyrhizobium yuanmingense TaxID=108015 RepID=UPI0023B8D002|nr:type II toxin-antitoxin system HicA family toxin [Bradyrhizobium yuanmingense]MDF0498390.1 type II toxin-antitoxin system HicA family toxin [Bradyrhizobium yuanmingense]